MESNQKSYYCFEISTKNMSRLNQIKEDAVTNFCCRGIEELVLAEDELDKIEGHNLLSGENISDALVESINNNLEKNNIFSCKFFFYGDGHNELSDRFHDYLCKFNNVDISLTHKQYEDWNSEWKKHYQRINISERLSVVPEWEMTNENSINEIYINPGAGFGTGDHETTFLCLELMEELSAKVNTCLDFGCGSGILGIGAISKFNSRVDFCDIDKDSLENCLYNLMLNLPDGEKVSHRLVIRDKFNFENKYDLVFANILLNVLQLEKNKIIKSVSSNGYLIVSGILLDQVQDLITEYQLADSRLTVCKISKKDNWAAVLFQKRN